MKPRIAIPIPTSTSLDYNQRSWPVYADAIARSGGEPVQIPLAGTPAEIANLITTCQGVLLPGSPADVNPQKYGHEPLPECSPADPARENVDELLIQDAHNLYKPILAICFGAQSLNVWRGGTLVQHLVPMPVNHPAGRSVAIAHIAAIAPASLLGCIVSNEKPEAPAQEAPTPAAIAPEALTPETPAPEKSIPEAPEQYGFLRLPINSNHHQAIGIVGDGLRVTARCPQDAVIEAIEGGQSSDQSNHHFVLGVQWHPERSYNISPASQAIFNRFVAEAAAWTPRPIHTSVV